MTRKCRSSLIRSTSSWEASDVKNCLAVSGVASDRGAGTTGSGKTFVGQRILQEMLDYQPRDACLGCRFLTNLPRKFKSCSNGCLPLRLINAKRNTCCLNFTVGGQIAGSNPVGAALV